MKKFFAGILIVIYGVTAFGFTLHMHYCCGKLDKVSFVAAAKDNCPGMPGMKSKGCCDNKDYHFSIKADQEVSQSCNILWNAQVPLCCLQHHNSFSFPDHQTPLQPADTGPPVPGSSQPLFIQYCVYRI